MRSPRLDRKRQLVALAARQGGFFTARQAAELGYSSRLQHHHASAGNWKPVERGLYRLPDWPADANEGLVFATLWSRQLGVISHESALAFFEMGDLMPTDVHLTVPRGFRKRPIAGIILHRGELRPGDVSDHGAFRTTTPARTLADVAAAQISPEHLRSAVASAIRRGLVQKREILDVALDLPSEASIRLREALRAAEESI